MYPAYWQTNFLISVWKKTLLHFTFPSRFYGCLSMSPPKVIQVATNVLFICQYISTTLLHCTALDYIFSPKQWKIRKIGNLTLDYIPGKNKKIMNYFEKQIINKIYVSSDQLFRYHYKGNYNWHTESRHWYFDSMTFFFINLAFQ